MTNQLCFLLLIAICIPFQAYAQRHYKGVNGLEANYGLTIFKDHGTFLQVSSSRYLNRITYWKIGLNYLENHQKIKTPAPSTDTRYKTSKNYFVDGMIYKTVATNLSSIFFSLGIGAFLGAEKRFVLTPEAALDKKYRCLFGPKAAMETEVFMAPRWAVVGSLAEYWAATSKVNHWNTVWSVGLKFLLY